MSSSPTDQSLTFPSLPETLLLISLKAYFSPSRTISYLESILDASNEILPPPHLRSHLLLCLIPDFLTLYPCSQILSSHVDRPGNTSPANPHLLLGAQDCHTTSYPGPSTGSIPTTHLKSLNVSIVELGHAERRSIYHETDAMVAQKALATTSQGLIPLICIGETSAPGPSATTGPASMLAGTAMREITSQILTPLTALPTHAPVILAYEPVWAIGAKQPASVTYVAAVVAAIRETVRGLGRQGVTRVVYGGSAGPGLWRDGGLGEVVDGMFLGRFAHEIDGLKAVVGEVVEPVEGRLKKGTGER